MANLYTPANGYFPLAPWTGFAVLAGWAALALSLVLVPHRDHLGDGAGSGVSTRRNEISISVGRGRMGFQRLQNGPVGCVTKLSGDGRGLSYGARFGGTKRDLAQRIALDSTGAAIIAGHTLSPDFPTPPDAFDATLNNP